MFTPFKSAQIDYFAANPTGSQAATDTLTKTGFDQAQAEITNWDGYCATPLVQLSGLARDLNLADIHYKDEGPRFGLSSFKALGGAYAVLRVLQRQLTQMLGRDIALDDVRSGKYAAEIKTLTVISATDGNHGRSVAWGAERFGVPCRIYIHAEVSEFRTQAMREFGAEVVRVNGDYDATVAQTKVDAEEHGWLIVSDTSWAGYTAAPLDVMAGYGLMAREIVDAMPAPPSHVFVQGGVGGFAAGVAAVFAQEWGAKAPRFVVVEPDRAPCLIASARAGASTTVAIEEETIMAGLSCGEPSEIAWSVLAATAQDFMTVPDSVVAPTVRMLARPQNGDQKIEAGESAVAGLCGAICAAKQAGVGAALGLDETSVVLVIGSEGITDPTIFAQIMSEKI